MSIMILIIISTTGYHHMPLLPFGHPACWNPDITSSRPGLHSSLAFASSCQHMLMKRRGRGSTHTCDRADPCQHGTVMLHELLLQGANQCTLEPTSIFSPRNIERTLIQSTV